MFFYEGSWGCAAERRNLKYLPSVRALQRIRYHTSSGRNWIVHVMLYAFVIGQCKLGHNETCIESHGHDIGCRGNLKGLISNVSDKVT